MESKRYKMRRNSLLVDRRRFLKTSLEAAGAAAGAGLLLGGLPSPLLARGAADKKLLVGVIGVSLYQNGHDGRGTALAKELAALPDFDVAYVCDVDERSVKNAAEKVAARQPRRPEAVRDLRRILDDRAVDAVVIAAPDHWHAPAAVLACAAGKHVYVEKPASHNAREGELLVAAARKHDRRVQLGTQKRSWPGVREAIEKLRAGRIGRVALARSFYQNGRPTIGRGKASPVPSWLDWDLWQGPAPEREFRDNVVPYNWHWFWHWGTGELGNNGVHTIDVCRWGLGVTYPSRIVASGVKLRFDDDQETPDTHLATFDFPGATITWEGRSWSGQTKADPDAEIVFHGTEGTLAVRGGGYSIYDPQGKEVEKGGGKAGDEVHLQNFAAAVRGEGKLNAEIEEGHLSTLLCHLGNIAHRAGRPLRFDPAARSIQGDAEAARLWGREYRKGWEPVA